MEGFIKNDATRCESRASTTQMRADCAHEAPPNVSPEFQQVACCVITHYVRTCNPKPYSQTAEDNLIKGRSYHHSSISDLATYTSCNQQGVLSGMNQLETTGDRIPDIP